MKSYFGDVYEAEEVDDDDDYDDGGHEDQWNAHEWDWTQHPEGDEDPENFHNEFMDDDEREAFETAETQLSEALAAERG
eukprot:5443462-Alexandrium_andersonii.AAC.1